MYVLVCTPGILYPQTLDLPVPLVEGIPYPYMEVWVLQGKGEGTMDLPWGYPCQTLIVSGGGTQFLCSSVSHIFTRSIRTSLDVPSASAIHQHHQQLPMRSHTGHKTQPQVPAVTCLPDPSVQEASPLLSSMSHSKKGAKTLEIWARF